MLIHSDANVNFFFIIKNILHKNYTKKINKNRATDFASAKIGFAFKKNFLSLNF